MFKKKYYLMLIVCLFTTLGFSEESIFIKIKVNDYIVTNIDIEKETSYLEILNPNIIELDSSKIYDLTKKSIVKEIIKKNEINKFFVLEDKDFIDNKLLNDLLEKLDLNENEFENLLTQKKSYTLEEIKKKLKIDIFWNDLIYYKFNKQIRINENEITNKVNKLKSSEKKEYLLSEIIFEKKQTQSLNEYSSRIKESINEIGFKNTANIYSLSETSKFGGKIGWVDENNLSKVIIDNLNNLKEGEHTDVIQIGNNYLILMIDEIKINKLTIDKEKELKKLIQFETNKQLSQFSKIYFNKVSVNYFVDEK